MKLNITSKTCRFCVCAGLVLCSAAMVSAAVTNSVTFQVDMSQAVADAIFDPNTQTMAARGTFNNWGNSPNTPFALTNNPSGVNTNLWTGTVTVTNPASSVANLGVMAYKYTIQSAGTYESSHNRLVTLTNNGSTIVPKAYFGDPVALNTTVSVKFQVDLAQQINTGAFNTNTSLAYARGAYNGWGTDIAQTNDPTILRTNQFGLVTSNVYVLTRDVTATPGQTLDYKYYIDTGGNWESPAAGTGDPTDNNNRLFNVASAASQTLPIVYFGDSPFAPVATNDVTFQVDMTAQTLNGNFIPGTDVVELRGDFNSWGTPQIICTNDPAASNTNVYKIITRIIDGIGASRQYKFWGALGNGNGGWETLANNRSFNIVAGTSQTLPVVFFSDINPSDLLPADTLVTFSVNMTNAVGTDSHVFDPANDTVHINGVPNFATWDNTLQHMTHNPVGSWFYSLQILNPKGSPVRHEYKYNICGVDDEAQSGNKKILCILPTGI